MFLKDISFIIPVYNRPDEIDELLNSFLKLNGSKDFEIVIIEDGSTTRCENILIKYKSLNISYHYKENSGPGDSRNFGMSIAKGNYFIILDSDCILPKNYSEVLLYNLSNDYSDCFGGIDGSHHTFNSFQKAVSFSMTSFLTTGFIRGGGNNKNFQPRSFNMGISKSVFEKTKGFGKIHPGEDPDLSIRIKKLGYKTKLYNDLKVYHKRRISVSSFFNQVKKFGIARSILNNYYPETKKIIYWFPSIFSIGLIFSIFLFILGINYLILLYIIYFSLLFVLSSINNNLFVGFISIVTTLVQFFGYGYGFLISFVKINIYHKLEIEEIFPKMFFK